MNTKTKITIGFIGLSVLLCVVVSCVLFATACMFKSKTTAEIMYSRWGIMIPDDMELLYHNSTIGWPSDGEECHVYKLKEEPIEFLEDFTTGRNEKAEEDINRIIESFKSAKQEITATYLIDFESEYRWKFVGKNEHDGRFADYIYILYFPNLLQLSFFEYLM